MKSTILFRPFFINGPFSKRVCIVKPTEERSKSDSLRAKPGCSLIIFSATSKKKKILKIYGSTDLAVPFWPMLHSFEITQLSHMHINLAAPCELWQQTQSPHNPQCAHVNLYS